MAEFTKTRTMAFPRVVTIGHDVISQTPGICRDLQFKDNGILVSGEKTYPAAGALVKELMEKEGFNITKVIAENSTMENVDKVADAVQKEKASFILAIGGGSKIDICKIAAKKSGKPFISIPTSVAHDGIASDRASLKCDNGPKSVQAVSPLGMIADTSVISRSPYRFLASGCGDVISNLTALKDWELACSLGKDEMSSSAYILSRYAADNIMANCNNIHPESEESVWLVMRPIVASGTSMSIAGSSRPVSGSEHMFSHALDQIHPGKALHGEQCGVGSIMMMDLHKGDWKGIRDALHAIGAPTTASELGMSDDDIIDALTEAHSIRKDRYTILGDNGLTKAEATDLARRTGVI